MLARTHADSHPGSMWHLTFRHILMMYESTAKNETDETMLQGHQQNKHGRGGSNVLLFTINLRIFEMNFSCKRPLSTHGSVMPFSQESWFCLQGGMFCIANFRSQCEIIGWGRDAETWECFHTWGEFNINLCDLEGHYNTAHLLCIKLFCVENASRPHADAQIRPRHIYHL